MWEEATVEALRQNGSLELVEVKTRANILALGSENVDFGSVGRHIAGVVLDPNPRPNQAVRTTAITIR